MVVKPPSTPWNHHGEPIGLHMCGCFNNRLQFVFNKCEVWSVCSCKHNEPFKSDSCANCRLRSAQHKAAVHTMVIWPNPSHIHKRHMKSNYLNNQFFNHILFNQVARYMPETWSGFQHSSPWQAAYQGQMDVPLCVDVGRGVCCLKSHFSCSLIWWPTCAGFLHTAWMSMGSDQELHTLTVKLHQRAHTAYTTAQTRLSSLNKGTCYIKHIWSDSQSSKPGSKLDMFDRAS